MADDQEKIQEGEEVSTVSPAPKGWGDGRDIRKSFGEGLESFSKLCLGPGGPPCGENSSR